jgi:hypothetical protein
LLAFSHHSGSITPLSTNTIPSDAALPQSSLSRTATSSFLRSIPRLLSLHKILPGSTSAISLLLLPLLSFPSTCSRGQRFDLFLCHAQDLQFYGPGPSWLGANDAYLWHV